MLFRSPQRGLYAEISARAALPGGAGTFGGGFASVRFYHALAPWLVLAGRMMLEMLWGEIPFYELVHWGGLTPVTGFGGFETLRGISFGRWRAPGKLVLNAEARFYVVQHRLFGRLMRWQLALLADAGTVFGAGDDATAPPPAFPLHPAAGVGVRAIYQNTFVGRIDSGFGLDPIRELDGSVTHELSFGIYVVFDHAF